MIRKAILSNSLSAMVVLLLLAVGTSACSSQSASAPAPQPAPTVATAKGSGKTIAEGKVVPIRYAALSFQTGGTIDRVEVALGDQVQAGQLLARLDTRRSELQLAQAEAKLAAAQANRNELKRGPTPEDFAAAQQNLVSAEAAYDNLVRPVPSDIAALKADVDKAQAALDQAQAAYDRVGGDANPQRGMLPQRVQLQSAFIDLGKAQQLYNTKLNPPDAQIQQGRAAIETAKSQLAKLQPTAEDLAAAQANVNAAQAERDLAAEQVREASLVAPFGGIVALLDAHAGEFTAPGPVVARVADTSGWQIETTDLTELSIVNIDVGMLVTMTFDAIPELELPGHVTQIEQYGKTKQGDITYTVIIAPDQPEPRLRWNMTATVKF